MSTPPPDDEQIPLPTPYTPVSGSAVPPVPPAQPYPGAYPAPYQAAGQQQPQTVLSLLAMIFGIVGLVLVCCYGAGVIFSIAAVVLGHLGVRKESARGMAMTGIITGYVGAGAAILFWILLFVVAFSPLLFLPFMAN